MIVNTAIVTVHPDKRIEFRQTIGDLLAPTKATKGCLRFRCYFDAIDENSSLLMGEWESEDDLDNYLRSDEFAVLRGAITVLGIRSVEFKASVTSYAWTPQPMDDTERVISNSQKAMVNHEKNYFIASGERKSGGGSQGANSAPAFEPDAG